MGYSAGDGSATALLLACPRADLEGAHALCLHRGFAVLPAGGAGDLWLAPLGGWLFIVDVDLNDDASRPVARWRARLGVELPLDPDQFHALLPPSWMVRHPKAYERARTLGHSTDDDANDADPWERQWELDGEPVPHDGGGPDVQVFLPVTELAPLDTAEWIFTNELVPKQARRGRRFLPRVPTLVQLPE